MRHRSNGGGAGREVYSALDKTEVQDKAPSSAERGPRGVAGGKTVSRGVVCFLTGDRSLVGQGRGK